MVASTNICIKYSPLTYWGRDKMDAIFQTPFSNGWSWIKMYVCVCVCVWRGWGLGLGLVGVCRCDCQVMEWLIRVGIHIPNIMVTSSNGNIFRVTGPLCGKFTGDRWIPGQWGRTLMLSLICAWNNCNAITWIVISNSLDIDFIHGDIHGWSCKKIKCLSKQFIITRKPTRHDGRL